MSKQDQHQRQLLLGLFLLVTFSVLAFYTLFLTDFELFGEPVLLRAEFPEAHNLSEGDPVTVAGMRAGRVRSIAFDPAAPEDRRITVELKLDEPVQLREGYSIAIEEATMLGGRVVNIDPGPASGVVVSTDTALPGRVRPNPLSGLGDIVDDNRDSVRRFTDNLARITDDLRDGKGMLGRALQDEALGNTLQQGVTDLTAFAADARELSGRLVAGEGTLGKLFTEDELHESLKEISTGLRQTIDDLKLLSADLRQGKGTLGKLLQDDELASEVDKAVRSIRSIAEKIDKGEGTIGKLLTDDKIAMDIETITSKVASGEGTLGKLIASDEIYQRLLDASDGLGLVVEDLRDGEGTLGLLLSDKQLYQEALTAVKLLNSSLEDYREAAPITSFTSVLFSAF